MTAVQANAPNSLITLGVPSSIGVPTTTGVPILDLLYSLYNRISPAANLFLTSFGFARVAPDTSVGEQFQSFVAHKRLHSALKKLLPDEIEDIKNSIKGLLISAGVDRSKLVSGTPLDAHINQLAKAFEASYPALFLVSPSLIKIINPRSKLFLATALMKAFSRFTTYLSPEQASELAARVTRDILSTDRNHFGMDVHEIAEVAENAINFGLLPLSNAKSFSSGLKDILAVVAPIRELYLERGQRFSPREALDYVNRLIQQYPTASISEIALEGRRRLEFSRHGGEYNALLLHPIAAEYARFSGVPVADLSRQHEQLKSQAKNSYIAGAIGAIARAVKTGMVGEKSPAASFYREFRKGNVPMMLYPMHVFSILVSSGVNPYSASLMLGTPEENIYWLSPDDELPLRRLQFNVDWAPRFWAIGRLVPGTDPQSRAARDALLTQVVRQGGYNNIHHFLALHGDIMGIMPSVRDLVTTISRRKHDLAGYERASWGGPARAMAELQDIGTGATPKKLSLEDMINTVLQVYRLPKGFDSNLGLLSKGEIRTSDGSTLSGSGTRSYEQPFTSPYRTQPVSFEINEKKDAITVRPEK